MWRIAVLFAVACASAPATHHRTPPAVPEARGPIRLVFGPASPGGEVTNATELEEALARKGKPTAALAEVVQLTWGDQVLDRAAIRQIVEAYHDWPARNALRERYKVADYDGVLRVVLQGYAAQLAQRFGIEPREVWASPEAANLRVGVRGLFGGRVVDWNTGVFSISYVTSYPARLVRASKTIETLITSDRGDYYNVKDLGIAYFRPIDAPADSDKVHHGAVLRTYAEPVEFVDANGVHYPTTIEITRPTPYVIARPGGLPRIGLTKDVHLVRLELDDRGLGSSAPIIDSVVVLDGTPAFPADLAVAYRAVWQHYNSDAHAAELAVANDVRATLATFDTRTKDWAKQVQPTGPVQSSEREYVHSNPTYAWDAGAKTITATFAHEQHVMYTKTIEYPNPALASFHCQRGAPCAVPPQTLSHVLELEYVIAFTASYRIERDGRITPAAPVHPRLSVSR